MTSIRQCTISSPASAHLPWRQTIVWRGRREKRHLTKPKSAPWQKVGPFSRIEMYNLEVTENKSFCLLCFILSCCGLINKNSCLGCYTLFSLPIGAVRKGHFPAASYMAVRRAITDGLKHMPGRKGGSRYQVCEPYKSLFAEVRQRAWLFPIFADQRPIFTFLVLCLLYLSCYGVWNEE